MVRDYLRADSHSAQALNEALAHAGGNQTRAAHTLGLTVRQLGYRLKKLSTP